MENFKIGQLTKELVALKLRKMDDPCAAAADLVKKTLVVAFNGIPAGEPGHGPLVQDACQGAMTSLFMADHSLSRGAVLLLEAMAELAAEYNLDPAYIIRAGLRGIADLRRFVRPETLYELQNSIEAHFMGAGEAFSECIAEAEHQSSGRFHV
ncbi:MAG: hypothetical protein WC881_07610 [Elusimicrobiota bacterium]|jgi:hypothetical protein